MLAVGLCLFAELLAELHQQGVVFAVELGIRRQAVHEQLLHARIVGVFVNEIVAQQDAEGVGVHHEDRLFRSVQSPRIQKR